MARMRRLSLVLGLATIMSAPFTPKQALAWVVAAGEGVFPVSAGNLVGHSVTGAFSYDAKGAANIYEVAFNCTAVATPDGSSTGVGECYVTNGSGGVNPALGSGLNLLGTAAAAAGATVIFGSEAEGCIEIHATFVESLLGPEYLSSGTVCKLLNLITV